MKVYFVGAGPGDPKLITVRGKELLKRADLVVYTGSLINREVLNYTDGKIINSHGMKLEEITKAMIESVKAGKTVVRLHSGDPSIYSATFEQINVLKENGVEVEVIPGVSSIFSSAAQLKSELTLNGQTLIITRPEGKTLKKDQIEELSNIDATIAIFLGVHKIEEVIKKVKRPKETPVAVVYHASWPDEKIICGTIEDIVHKVKEEGIKKSAMIIIGSLYPSDYNRSYLYS